MLDVMKSALDSCVETFTDFFARQAAVEVDERSFVAGRYLAVVSRCNWTIG